jgi:hypothetical protein
MNEKIHIYDGKILRHAKEAVKIIIKKYTARRKR